MTKLSFALRGRRNVDVGFAMKMGIMQIISQIEETKIWKNKQKFLKNLIGWSLYQVKKKFLKLKKSLKVMNKSILWKLIMKLKKLFKTLNHLQSFKDSETENESESSSD